MGRGESSDESPSRSVPNIFPNYREGQIISKAMNLVEKRIDEGTASPSEVIHFLKLGSSLAILERQKLENEVKMLGAKTTSIESTQKTEELYREAISQMKIYRGESDD